MAFHKGDTRNSAENTPTGVEVTDRQLQILRLIQASHEWRGHAPTVHELCAVVGVRSTGAMNKHIYALERKGLIEREVATWRSPRLTELGRRVSEVEIFGLRSRRDDGVNSNSRSVGQHSRTPSQTIACQN